MSISLEGVGSVPRPAYLLGAMGELQEGKISDADYEATVDRALAETIAEMAATGSAIITDGEQSKPSFATYPLSGLANLAAFAKIKARVEGTKLAAGKLG